MLDLRIQPKATEKQEYSFRARMTGKSRAPPPPQMKAFPKSFLQLGYVCD